MKQYQFQADTQVWMAEDYHSISYTDGSEVESRLLQIVANANDLSSLSEELESHVTDWASEYHLSRKRHCLLRPINIKPGDRVLELGCGCGAITRYLGETGAEVVSVEGSLSRAQIASSRCRDLENVTIYCDNLTTFSYEEKFDWVLLIGVLEYAPMFATGSDPVYQYLNKAGFFLADAGQLVVAIENQLGLKYFNGCTEDHMGRHFYGINDLYSEATAVTFGQKELTSQLTQAGFIASEYYFPYPDYKLPTTIINQSAFAASQFNVSAMLLRLESRDYCTDTRHLFSENFTSQVLERNDLLQFFSNSFLVIASRESVVSRTSDALAWVYSIGQRKTIYCTATIFTVSCKGEIVVTKQPLLTTDHPSRKDIINEVKHSVYSEPYIEGSLLAMDVVKTCLRSEQPAEIAASFSLWFQSLKKMARNITGSTTDQLEDLVLSGDMIDATPFNSFLTEQGMRFFDQEWQSVQDIPLGWVLYRSVLWTLKGCLFATAGVIDTCDIVQRICHMHSLQYLQKSFLQWQRRELRLMSLINYKQTVTIEGVFAKRTSFFTQYDADLNLLKQRDSQIVDINSKVKSLNRLIKQQDQLVLERDHLIKQQDQLVLERDHLIKQQDQLVLERDHLIKQQDQLVLERDHLIKQLGSTVVRQTDQIVVLDALLQDERQKLLDVYGSISWKITAALRYVSRKCSRFNS